MATGENSTDYKLSCEVLGHSADVRAVKSFSLDEKSRDHLLTASRDGTACVWAPDLSSNRDYVLKNVFKKHTGYVSSLCVIPPDPGAGREQPLVATGGQDNTILVHSLEEGMEEPIERCTGHKELVTCIIFQHNQLISSSWDSTVRVWTDLSRSEVIEAHRPAVWSVSGLFQFDGTRRILSGGADRVIKLWEVDSKMCLQEYHGHADVVRDIKITSMEFFFSAANDCIIREWNIHSGQCLREIYGHEAYVYSLDVRPRGGGGEDFVSCGEDSTVRVWQGAECKQVIRQPATSIWVVCYMTNGDIVTGSSDGVVRIFTRDESRMAPSSELSTFDCKVEEHKSSGAKSDIDVSKLPGRDALLKPGRSSGDTLIINNDGVPEVYQWNSGDSEWLKIGNAVGKAPDDSKVYNGKEYDFVFDIELDETSPTKRTLKLPYNQTTDPYVAAEDFLSANNLPAYYLDQVAEFIVQNAGAYQGPVSSGAADPFTGGTRYVPGGSGSSQGGPESSDPFTGGNRYCPGGGLTGQASDPVSLGGTADPFTGGGSYRPAEFQSSSSGASNENDGQFTVSFKGSQLASSTFDLATDFRFFSSTADYGSKVIGKIKEFNETMYLDQRLTKGQLDRLKYMCDCFSGRDAAKMAGVKDKDLKIIDELLDWPPHSIFPVLDLVRLALLTDVGHGYLFPDIDRGKMFAERLFGFAVGPHAISKNQLVVLRALSNVFSRGVGLQVLDEIYDQILTELFQLYPISTTRASQIALSTVVLNYCRLYHKTRKLDGLVLCTKHVCKVLEGGFDSEAKFRALIAAGSLALVNKDGFIASAQPADIVHLVQTIKATTDIAKVKACAETVLDTLLYT